MCKKYKKFKSIHHLPKIIFGLAALVLAVDPIIWLINTWLDSAYDSQGLVIFFIFLLLFLWSVSSNRISDFQINYKIPLGFLVFSGLTRLFGQIYAVNFIGALTLVLDVYAVALLSGLHLRKRSLSPGWLAVCFAFSLPLERILQRTIGYSLQSLSADAACLILSSLFDDVRCHGIRIWMNQQDVLIDLPCSGAGAILLLEFFYVTTMTICRPTVGKGFLGALVTLITGLITNIFRIIVFALNISFPDYFFGIDVMSEPWHDLAGLLFLALGCIPIIYWTSKNYSPVHYDKKRFININSSLSILSLIRSRKSCRERIFRPLFQAIVCLCLAFLIVNLPRKPIDVGKKNLPLNLPIWINGDAAKFVPLLPKEEAYFKKYGGAAVKADYGIHSLLLVKTTSPLRHLHSPDECLRGLGFKVRYKGVSNSSIPSSIYKAISKNNSSYRIAVSFISNEGVSTSNISEAIWHWFKNPKSEWLSVQRISPWNIDSDQYKGWDEAVFTALDINSNNFQGANDEKSSFFYPINNRLY
jgi:exosortase/archaeosortase family protein